MIDAWVLIYFGSPAEVIFIGNYTMLPEQVVEVKLSIAVREQRKMLFILALPD